VEKNKNKTKKKIEKKKICLANCNLFKTEKVFKHFFVKLLFISNIYWINKILNLDEKMALKTLFRNVSSSLLTERSHLFLFRKQTPVTDFVHVTLNMQKCDQIKCLLTGHTTSELLWNNSLQSLCKLKCVSLSCSSSVWCSMKNCIRHLF